MRPADRLSKQIGDDNAADPPAAVSPRNGRILRLRRKGPYLFRFILIVKLG
jgi:hypothetical protein